MVYRVFVHIFYLGVETVFGKWFVMLVTDVAQQMWGISFNQQTTNRRQLQQGTLDLHVLSNRILHELFFLLYWNPHLRKEEMSLLVSFH